MKVFQDTNLFFPKKKLLLIISILYLTSSFSFADRIEQKDLPLWYWRQKSFVNFGDYLSLKIVERMAKKPIKEYFKKPTNNIPKLLALGSIISFADSSDVIWGSGINGKVLSPSQYAHPETWDIRAVRGPLSRKFIIDELNVPCPKIYGDPALLIPRLFPEFKRKINPSRPYVIIPHYSELGQFDKSVMKNVVYPTEAWDEVINKILDSEFVISSSLHGLIIAEAFGIPARFLRVSKAEPLFKYHDYYLGTGRSTFQPAFSVAEALDLGGEPPINIDLDRLYNAFPFEHYQQNQCQSVSKTKESKHPDLEAINFLDDFIVETKQINIPGYPDAFNPSIVKWNGTSVMSFRTGDSHAASDINHNKIPSHIPAFLLSFRKHEENNKSFTNDIGLIFLDSQFEPISTPQILTIKYNRANILNKQQDPRLITIDNRLFMVYCNMIADENHTEARRMFIVELTFKSNHFTAGTPVPILQFAGESQGKWQKNWVPFEYDKELLFSYSINTHRVLKPDMQSGDCSTVADSKANFDWEWGALRGGTPALLDDGSYLSFFHSSKEMKSLQTQGKKLQHYFMGGYTFSAKPPFALEKISKKPIIGKKFYNGPSYEGETWKPLRVVFPGGLIIEDKYIWVFYGRQDHETWAVKLDKQKFYQSLVKVNQ